MYLIFSLMNPGVALITAVCVQWTLLRFVQHVSRLLHFPVRAAAMTWSKWTCHQTSGLDGRPPLVIGCRPAVRGGASLWLMTSVCRWRAGCEMCDTRAKTGMRFLTGTETTPKWCLGYADRTPPAWELAWLVFLDSHFPKPPQIQWHSLCSPRSRHVP